MRTEEPASTGILISRTYTHTRTLISHWVHRKSIEFLTLYQKALIYKIAANGRAQAQIELYNWLLCYMYLRFSLLSNYYHHRHYHNNKNNHDNNSLDVTLDEEKNNPTQNGMSLKLSGRLLLWYNRFVCSNEFARFQHVQICVYSIIPIFQANTKQKTCCWSYSVQCSSWPMARKAPAISYLYSFSSQCVCACMCLLSAFGHTQIQTHTHTH